MPSAAIAMAWVNSALACSRLARIEASAASAGFAQNAQRLLADRLRKLPVERVVILEGEQDEPERVVVAKPEGLLHPIELLPLGRLRFPPEQLFEG